MLKEINQVTKIKNGTISLPSQITKSWKEAQIYIQYSQDNIFIKRMNSPELPEMLKQLKKVGNKISKRDLEKAISWARKTNKK